MTELKELERSRSNLQLAALTQGWRETLAAACRMEGDFQLATGAAGMPVEDSSGLLHYSDIVVPRGAAAWVSEAGGSTRSDAYLHLLHRLLPAAETGLRGFLGPQYERWIACRNADPRSGAHLPLFRVWANNNLSVERAAAAMRLYMDELDDPLLRALDRFFCRGGRLPVVGRTGRIQRLPLYSATYATAFDHLSAAEGATIAFDSNAFNLNGADQGTVAPGRARYFWSRSQRQSPALRELDNRALGHRITIAGQIGRVASIATEAGDWLDAFEIERAWAAGDDPAVWDEAAGGGWNDFFGPDGSLARRVARIVLAGGYDLTVTSHACYSAEEAALVRAEATGGVWPMIAGESAPTHKVRVRHNPDGTLSHLLSLAPDRVQIIGGLLAEMPG